MLYEINYLVLQSKTGELEKIRENAKKMIESFGAKITAEREYLKRKLSYEINHEQYGFYTVLRLETEDNQKLQELKKALNLEDSITRYIIVRADELPSLEEQAEKEKELRSKTTLKQEEVEKALAKESKETAPEKSTEAKTEAQPAEIETGKKEESEEKKEESAEPKEDDSTSTESTEDKSETDEKDSSDEETEEEEKKKKKDEKDNVSLDDLDKKLDEILNL